MPKTKPKWFHCVPDEVYERLKASTEQHRRSLNSEAIVCLETALMPYEISAAERVARARQLRAAPRPASPDPGMARYSPPCEHRRHLNVVPQGETMIRMPIAALAWFGASAAFGADIPPEFAFWKTFDNSATLRSRADSSSGAFENTVYYGGPFTTNNLDAPGYASSSVRNQYDGDLLFSIKLQAVSPAFLDHAAGFAEISSKLTLEVALPEDYSFAIFQLVQSQSYRVQEPVLPVIGMNLYSRTEAWWWNDDGDFSAAQTQVYGGTGAALESGSYDLDFTAYLSSSTHFVINQLTFADVAANAGTWEAEIGASAVHYRVTYFKNPGDTSGYSVTYDGKGAAVEEGYTPVSWTTEPGWVIGTVPEPSTWLMSGLGVALLAAVRRRGRVSRRPQT